MTLNFKYSKCIFTGSQLASLIIIIIACKTAKLTTFFESSTQRGRNINLLWKKVLESKLSGLFSVEIYLQEYVKKVFRKNFTVPTFNSPNKQSVYSWTLIVPCIYEFILNVTDNILIK